MTEISGRSAGVSLREIDLTGPRNVTPTGVPAGVIGTAIKGPAFVPMTFATIEDFVAMFGSSDGSKFGPLAVAEWLQTQQAATFVRVLGAGKGEKRAVTGNNTGRVENAGFVVGQQLPLTTGLIGSNPYANFGGPHGRLSFLGCFMSESAGSTIFSSAGIQPSVTSVPIIRGVLMAPSGVIMMLGASGSVSTNDLNVVADLSGINGDITGSVSLSDASQSFVLLLNGHKGTDPEFPNFITASLDQTAPNYFANVLNTNPYKIQEAGHYLYARYDIHPALATVTGSGIIVEGTAVENIAFLTTGTLARNLGSATVPNYENFEDRFTTPATPTFVSQKFGGVRFDLFRVHALSDGKESNTKFKISIQNVANSTVSDRAYGTFDLLVRDFNDNDDNRIVLESFAGVTLDPENENYIANRVGDMHAYYDFDKNQGGQKLVIDGKYPNASKYIRVEVNGAVDSGDVDPSALPIGFRGPAHLVTSGSNLLTAIDAAIPASAGLLGAGSNALKRAVEPPIPFRDHLTIGQDPKKFVNKQLYWGVQFEQKIAVTEPNSTRVLNKSILSHAKFFPKHQLTWMNMSVGENAGEQDVQGTVLDSDRFNNNLFALDHIMIRTGSGNIIDAKEITSMSYVRNGQIAVDDVAKTRALNVALDFGDPLVRSLAKFTCFLQGGFDGTNVFDREADELTNTAVKYEMDDIARGQDQGPTVRSVKKALEIIGNVTDVDIKLLAVPGYRHQIITDAAIDTVESDRFDAMYIMDVEERDVLNDVIVSDTQDVNVSNTARAFSLRGLDTSFAAAYFPNVIMENPFTRLPVEVPPSVVVLGAFGLNDAIAHPWSAPAGFTRGSLQSTDSVALRLKRSNMDLLQDVDINPIASFPDSKGVVVWGQKTLQSIQSALDRVNVRRLLIEIRREIKAIATSLVFEPNRETTLARFSERANPVLQRIQEREGLSRFKVVIDTTTTSQADVENNTIRGKIFLSPVRTAEVVSIDFVVANLAAVE